MMREDQLLYDVVRSCYFDGLTLNETLDYMQGNFLYGDMSAWMIDLWYEVLDEVVGQ